MARRKKNKTRRRRFKGVNLWNVAESLVQANIVTQTLFESNPLEFLIGRDSGGYGRTDLAISNTSGKHKLGLGELLGLNESDGSPAVVRQRVVNNFKSGFIPMIGWSIATRAGFSFAKKMTKGFRRDINKGIKMVGLQNEVKV